ncbi:MarC family protein [Ferrovibrio sp. MS7]|jgi:multiple antibiotic resistance protein|uniref:MarC family protein n=1 Tax=Ferrovibrio plantarum TaxID=3119164 RepID=UPI001B6B6CCD|nr:NAAT family transporter [Ferrovibrio sp.]
MRDSFEYIRYAITLFSILDPFAAIPLFLMLMEGRSGAEKAKTARTAAIAVFGVLVVSALSGDMILRLLGASLAAFQVGGGIVLFLMALSMVNAQMSPQQQTPEEAAEAGARDAVGVVPIAMPLLVGPGSISATIITMQSGDGFLHQGVVILAILVVCVAVWIVLRLAVPIGQRMGRTGLNILNRIFGLLLAAVAVQIFANGLRGLFPGLH